MRILLVGGDYRNDCQITGYVNAVREISAELAKENEVFVIPYLPQRPQTTPDTNWNGAIIISRRPKFKDVVRSVTGLIRSYRYIDPYMHVHDQEGLLLRIKVKLKFASMYSFNRAFFESKMDEIAPDIVHVHGFLIQLLPFHDVLMGRDIPYVSTDVSHGER